MPDTTYQTWQLFSTYTLTTSYVQSTTSVFNTTDRGEGYNQAIVYIDVANWASVTSLQIQVLFSPDNINWYNETTDSPSAGTVTEAPATRTFVASAWSGNGQPRIAFEIKDKYMAIQLKGTGTVTSTSVSVLVATGNV